MNLKTLMAQFRANRIQKDTRKRRLNFRRRRRGFQDFWRREFESIHEAEKRSRGLRIFAAWSRPRMLLHPDKTAFELKAPLRQTMETT